jgi:probable HAF family extracellular repeat protein
MRDHSFLLGAVIVTMLAASSLFAEVLYHVTDLGTLGGRESTAWSINNKGQIVGMARVSDPSPWDDQPVLFDATGEGNNIDLSPEVDAGYAFAINSLGQIVGYVGDSWYGYGASRETWATLFDPTGHGDNVEFEAPDQLEWGSTVAVSINNAGQIVGTTFNIDLTEPFCSFAYGTLFDPTGNSNHVNLDGRGCWSWSEAYSINNKGQIVGMADPGPGGYRATLFDSTGGGNNINLGTLPGGGGSYAQSINDFGQIVGYAYNSSGNARATLFDPTGEGNNIDLGTLAGLESSWASSINNAGKIVGASHSAPSDYRATLFDPAGEGKNINLNDVIPPTPAWHLIEAQCINDSGWIVGFGENPEGQTHAFLLTPVSTDDFTLRLNVEPNDVGIDTTTPLPGEYKCLKGRAIDLEARLFKSCPAVYHFDHWEGDVVDPNSPLTTVIMDEDKMVTAVFVASEPVCGDECHPILRGDLNDDCYINFADFVLYSDMWMSCTHPDCD